MTETTPVLPLADLRQRAAAALDHWHTAPEPPALLAYRENAVFRIALPDGTPAALRLHRPGHYSQADLEAELAWMTYLDEHGLATPRPVASRDGSFLVALPHPEGTRFADVLSWVSGRPLGRTGTPLDLTPAALNAVFRTLGQTMARLHSLSDQWPGRDRFARPAWDRNGLLGETPLWGCFWQGSGLTADQAQFLQGLRDRLRERLDHLAGPLDYGLIHGDLVRENIVIQENGLALIDFNDCGLGYRLFELATALLKNRYEPHYGLIEKSLIDGYLDHRPEARASLTHLPLFMVLRSLTYVGWVLQRPELPDARDRLARYLTESRELAAASGVI